MPGLEVSSWQGLCTPAGIRAALAAAPDTRKRLADQGIQLTLPTPEKFGAFIRSERAKRAKLVKDLGIKPQ